jgi:hypothetical protein
MTQEQYEEVCRSLANLQLDLQLKLAGMLKDTRGLYEGNESIDLIRGQIRGLDVARSTLRLAVEDEDALWH